MLACSRACGWTAVFAVHFAGQVQDKRGRNGGGPASPTAPVRSTIAEAHGAVQPRCTARALSQLTDGVLFIWKAYVTTRTYHCRHRVRCETDRL